MSRLRFLFRNLLRRRRVESDLDDELRCYLDSLVADKTARGIDETEAMRLSRLEIGGIEQVKENVREIRMGTRLELLLRDFRFAVRALRKTPAFTGIAVLMLAIGIGANTAVFSVVDTVLLRPLPFPKPDQLVAVWENRVREKGTRIPVAPADFLDWRSRTRTLSGIALYDTLRLGMSGAETVSVPLARVTAGFFETIGVQPQLGRWFQTNEENIGHGKSVILTYGTWQRRFGGDATIVGHNVYLNGAAFAIVGVLPQSFRFPFAPDIELFIPIQFNAEDRTDHGLHMYGAIGRLREGVTIEQARSEIDVIAKQIEREHPDTNEGHGVNLVPLHVDLSGPLKPALVFLLGAVFLVILITCANVASLLLARASVRAREIAVRAALGCSRGRLIWHSLMESASLAVAGGVCGLALAYWGLLLLRSRFFQHLDFFATAGLDDVRLDWRVLLFTGACGVLSTLLFGLSPAVAGATTQLSEALRTRVRASGPGDRSRFRSALVVVQVALSLVLLTSAALLGKSFVRLISVDPGFRPDNVITADIELPGARYRSKEQATAAYDALLARAAALPGVRSAGITDTLPLSGNDNRIGVSIEGRRPPRGEYFRMHPHLVNPGYFAAMGIRLNKGRMFDSTDMGSRIPTAIISETAARRFWPNDDPLGKRFSLGSQKGIWITIVGMAPAVRHAGLDQDASDDVYLPYANNPYRGPVTAVTLVLNSGVDPAALVRSLRQAVASLDRSVAVSDIRSMQSRLDESVAPRRFNLILIGIFAGIAIVLAVAGLYGLLAYLVTQRTQEIGVRMALGAQQRDVIRLVIGRGLLLASIGIALGVVVSLMAAGVLSSLLFGVAPRDPAVFVIVPAVLLAVAVAATYIPARVAANVDPLVSLRME